jgi:hypothetical protein
MPEDSEDTSTSASDQPDPVQPAQDAAVAPVPAPGHADSSAGPGVRTGQGASPEDGVHAGDKAEGSDSSVSSPGAWTALAAPGKPDGEVDTRA